MALQHKVLKGRQMAWLIFNHYKVSATEGAILESEDLLAVEFKLDNTRAFINDWEMTLAGLKSLHTSEILESLNVFFSIYPRICL